MVVPVFILIGLFLIVLQNTILMINPVWPVAPDLYYILIAYLAYRFDLVRGLLILLPISVATDVFSGVILGINPAICFIAYGLLKTMAEKMPVRESYYQVPLIGVSYLLVNKVLYVILSFLYTGSISWSWPMVLLRLTLLLLFAFPLFKFFAFVAARLRYSFIPVRLLRVRTENSFRKDGEEG